MPTMPLPMTLPGSPRNVYLGLVAFSLVGTALSRGLRLNPGPIAPIASLLTLGFAIATVWPRRMDHGVADRAFLARAGLAMMAGAGAEIASLYTGWPFGHYRYSDAWWPTVELPGGLRFPLALPFAWLMVTLAALRATRNPWIAGVLAAGVDLVMEPVMVHDLRYWTWNPAGPLPGDAPWRNLFGWWITATVGAHLLHSPHKRESGEDSAEAERARDGWVVLVAHLAMCFGLMLLIRRLPV
ncbi:MAG: carotenoid biosynthesis protein [Fimbriimonadaceae bacterium]|nr:carotenoid biosynthesis protein [Fimbriimonadaceae bacterium]